MILVDTSIWIELLNGKVEGPPDDELLQFVTCGPILQEVLQGLREGAASRQFAQYFEAMICVGDPLSRRFFAAAAEIYRSGRRRGLTVRSPVDCLIAAIAIEYEIPVWHRDRDFDLIASYTDLQTKSGSAY